MKSDYDYQFPWRPIFELTAIAGWIGGAALAYLTSRWSGLPREPFDWLMGLCGVMVLWRLPPALSLWYRKRRLQTIPFSVSGGRQAQTVCKTPSGGALVRLGL